MFWIESKIGTASADEVAHEYHHLIDKYFICCLDLIDGSNDPELIYQKLKTALNQWHLDRKVIFFCFAGISRSNGMATTLIAYNKNIDWDDAYNITRKGCPRTMVCMDFRDSAIQALELMRKRLVKKCPYCSTPTEAWEESCAHCWSHRFHRLKR